MRTRVARRLCGLLCLASMIALALVAVPRQALADYTYKVRVFTGNQGTINGQTVYTVGTDYNGTTDECKLDKGWVQLDENSKYYVKGFRISGQDNDDGLYQESFVPTEDVDLVVAYGVKGNMVSCTVKFVEYGTGNPVQAEIADGTTSDHATFYGKEGDKVLYPYAYAPGYRPRYRNITGTLGAEGTNEWTLEYIKLEDDGASSTTTTTTTTDTTTKSTKTNSTTTTTTVGSSGTTSSTRSSSTTSSSTDNSTETTVTQTGGTSSSSSNGTSNDTETTVAQSDGDTTSSDSSDDNNSSDSSSNDTETTVGETGAETSGDANDGDSNGADANNSENADSENANDEATADDAADKDASADGEDAAAADPDTEDVLDIDDEATSSNENDDTATATDEVTTTAEASAGLRPSGPLIGLVVGVLAAVAALAYYLIRRKNEDEDDLDEYV